MQLKSKQENPITGVPVVEAKISLIVTARIRGQNFNLWPLPLRKLQLFIYAAVKKLGQRHSATAAIITKQADVRY